MVLPGGLGADGRLAHLAPQAPLGTPDHALTPVRTQPAPSS